MSAHLTRDRLAVLAALAAPLGLGAWDVDAGGIAEGAGIELLVESGGMFQGRFLMVPAPGARPTLEQRLLAVALADQVGAALATSHPVDQG